MNCHYCKLFTIPGAAGFSAAAFLGRLPAGMMSLAIILPIVMGLGSYAFAGLVAGATMIGMALCAPISGRLVDYYGHGRVLLLSVLINLLGTSALIVSIYFSAPLLAMCCAGLVAGASRLSTGTLARTRWVHVIQQLEPNQKEGKLQMAYAFESVVDEVVFISAPLLVTFLCTSIYPLAGLVACSITYTVGGSALALQRKTQPKINEVKEKQPMAFKVVRPLRMAALAVLFIGISAGSIEVIIVARATYLDHRTLIGVLMAILAFGSILSGFWFGAKKFKCSDYKLWVRCLGILFLILLPFIFATQIITLILTLFIAGLFIGPAAICEQIFIKHILPTRLLNEGMSTIITGMILGMAIGNWVAGALVSSLGYFYIGLIPATAVCIAFTIARFMLSPPEKF